MRGYRDYSEDPTKVPNSCCNQFDKSETTYTGKCKLEQLVKVGGCKAAFLTIYEKENPIKEWLMKGGWIFAIEFVVACLSLNLGYTLITKLKIKDYKNLHSGY